MAETQDAQGTQRIHEARDADRSFVIHPTDDDLFVRTGKQVVEACQLGITVEVWVTELKALVGEVRDWAEQNKETVRACYAAPGGGHINFFFVPQSESFDFGIAESLAKLHRNVISRFRVGRVELHQIPANELDRFVDVETARRIHGGPEEPHRAVAT